MPLPRAPFSQDVKLAVLVVLYHPNPADLDLLDKLRSGTIPSYLIDNTPQGEQKFPQGFLPLGAHFELIREGENIGLSRAYNLGFARARADGFSHVLVFDQDTRITLKTLSFITQILATKPEAGMLNFCQKKSEYSDQFEERLLMVNSATVFNLTCHKVVQGFNETYFVDFVDYDYCWRCLQAGIGIYQVQGTPGLDHLAGQPGRALRIFGKTLYARSYGKHRNAEILRGHLKLLGAGITSLQLPFSWAIFRSLTLFCIGRAITTSTIILTGKS
jgi:rhamnosyltransferase